VCTVECGFACELKTNGPDVCLSKCGDGHLASDEECDDDNVFGGDGCSSSCEIETGWTMTSGLCEKSEIEQDEVEQTVQLFRGVNYFSFWVNLEDQTITSILNRIPGMQHGSVSVFNTRSGTQPFISNTESTSKRFGHREIYQHPDNVYILNLQMTPVSTALTVTGPVYRKVATLGVIVGINWLPVIFDTTTSVPAMPIQIACPSGGATCRVFKYVQYDKYQRMYRDAFGSIAPSNAEIGKYDTQWNWGKQETFARGQTYKLVIVADETRKSGNTGRIPVQLNNLDSANALRINSYSTSSSRRRLLSLSTSTTTIDTHFCPTKLKESAGDAASCECVLTTVLDSGKSESIPWPRNECNKCVLSKQTGVCNNIGNHLDLNAMVFEIRVQPPQGYSLSSTSIAVAKLKRSFNHTDDLLNIHYEHISIRAFQHPYYHGCMQSGSVIWGDLACENDDKVYIFSLTMAALASEITHNDVDAALEVNFEFDIDGVKFVTKNTQKLKSEIRQLNGEQDRNTMFQIYQSKTYTLELQKFAVICPLKREFLQMIGSVCPFEGDLPAIIDIDSLAGDTTLKNFDPDADEEMPEISAKHIRIRRIQTGTSTFEEAPAEDLSYIIQRMPGVRTYVTVHEAVFDQCEYVGEYKFYHDAANNITMGCEPEKIAAGTILTMGGTCDSSKYQKNKQRITQSDKLSITRISGDRQTRTITTYNKNDQIMRATLDTEYVLMTDEESLEINVHIDANECKPLFGSTKIHISISDVSNIAKVDRLEALDTTSEKCVTDEDCKCRTLSPDSLIGWPFDECNGCVLQQDASCSGMGGNFATQGITYTIHINNTQFVDVDSVGVAKLKNSRPYDDRKDASSTGAKYPHLSIRDYAKPTCEGCYTNGLDNAPDFTPGACDTCPSTGQKIFFFQLTASAIDGGEIVKDGDPDPLVVNFEFSINGILYVTPTTKPLARVFNDQWTTVHNNPNMSPGPNEIMQWPQQIEIYPKLFGVVCSLDSPYMCPYEGNDKTDLAIRATAVTVSTISTYSFRTIAGGELYVRLDAFNVGLCSKEANYAWGGDPHKLPYYDELVYKEGGEPVVQEDQLQIVHYTVASTQRELYEWNPGDSVSAVDKTSWELRDAGDLLEIKIVNDGYYCAGGSQFEMHFSIQTTPFLEIVPVQITTTRKFQVTASYEDFASDSSTLRTKFVDTLATVYATDAASISLEYYSERTPETVLTARRRRLLQSGAGVGSDIIIVTAKIVSLDSVTLPSDDVVLQAMLSASLTVSFLANDHTPAENGSDFPFMWFFVGCAVFCAVVVLATIVVSTCFRQPRYQKVDTLQDRASQIENNQEQHMLLSQPMSIETTHYNPPFYDHPHTHARWEA